ncbi:ABC-type transport auxiliary lipoprotein family protein [Oricola sp.]|uniref:ABC-type transport auxiliary lipoprotein family protein n=1 Tax=Oricola sp. TaxID=1979950 RepID=UPI0025F5D344|nr:ABC-type transport auxiliary lipoprotein family protein [Oricola sp.]MCI5077271.1 ABC-type transport auxiliary lipoprotein family protein [Oricola sp.]
MKLLRAGQVTLVSLALAGCSAISGVMPSADTYELGVPTISKAGPVRRGTQILVAEPQALKALDSQNIVVRTDPLTIRYLGRSQWSDRLPRLVQMRLVQAFQNSDRFKGVGLPGQGLAIDYQIVTEIRSFGVDAGANSAHVAIAVKILNDRNGVVASERVFEQRITAVDGSNEAYVAAIDRAFADVASDIVVWVTGRL